MEECLSEKADVPHVFISYRRQDSVMVDELVALLDATYPVWRDPAPQTQTMSRNNPFFSTRLISPGVF